MLQKKEPVTTSGFAKGLFTKGNILVNEPGNSPNCMDIKWNFDESIQKRYGSTTRNSIKIGSTAVGGWVQNSSGTMSTGLLAYWRLDEPSGSRADSFGTYTLTDVGGPTDASGIRGQAVALTTSQYLYNASQVFTGSGQNMSISTWFYLNSTSASEVPLISKRDSGVGTDSNTVLLLHCDSAGVPGAFIDSSISGHSISTAGNVVTTTAQYVFGGYSASLPGVSGSYLSIGDSADWDFGSNPLTIDFRVRFNIKPTYTVLFDHGAAEDRIQFYVTGTQIICLVRTADSEVVNVTKNWSANTATWYHVALVRGWGGNANDWAIAVDGTMLGTVTTNTAGVGSITGNVALGARIYDGGQTLNGYFDEYRVTKGVARWTDNFTPPTAAYSATNSYEYYLYVNTNNLITWRVSSSGTAHNGTVEATSLGTVNTSTWYNTVVWHTTGSHLGISANLSVNTAPYTALIKISSSPIMLGATSNGALYMNGRMDETAFWSKTLSKGETEDIYGGGSGNTYSQGNSNYSWGMYDFGASSLRWLMVSAGTGIYASSNMGLTFVTAATTRTQNYQSFERSKNVLIMTSDAYDLPLYWAGSVGTYAQVLAPASAPSVKFAINYQGYLILMNASTNKRRFYYSDDSVQLTSDWTDYFDLPSSADDEITAAFIVNRILYVSTRYRLYKLSITGGNPDWQYTQVKAWGFVPRTVGICFMQDREWAIGMDWNRRIRAFDGFNEMFISDNVESDNGICDFAMSKISYSGSGLTYSNGIFDPIEQEYRLNVVIGQQSSQTTHSILLNTRSKALYPYANQSYQAMCTAESDNRLHLMACDRAGLVHVLNSGNTDAGVPINEIYESPFIFNKVPGMVSKGGKIDLFFKPTSAGTIYFQDKADFQKVYPDRRKELDIQETDENGKAVTHIYRSIDIPSTHNILQYSLMSSSSTTEPWVLTHTDFYQQSMGIGRGN